MILDPLSSNLHVKNVWDRCLLIAKVLTMITTIQRRDFNSILAKSTVSQHVWLVEFHGRSFLYII